MESYRIENLSFTYPTREKAALCDISLTISQGEFVTICGKSGCGKTTLLRLLKSSLSPHGELKGKIYFKGEQLSEIDTRTQAGEIGFVMQSPDNQIACDKVWHELAFGLESLGYSTGEIRTRVSEMASFFGIESWFYKKVTELSGGQKQMLSLASIMVMQPSVLILDEPTSQLDPIAAQEFLKTLEKINRELGVAIIITEHRLEDVFPLSDRVIVLDEGRIIADAAPQKVGEILKKENHDMYMALPTPMRICGAVENDAVFPLTVREGRYWFTEYVQNNTIDASLIPKPQEQNTEKEVIIEIKDAFFRYEKGLPDVIKNLSVKVRKGELFAILGGNGAGKTTALSLMGDLNTPYRGKVLIGGEEISKVADLHGGVVGMLPQNPQALFVKKTVYLDLLEILSEKRISPEEKEERIKNISALCRIGDLMESHPYDLSGGEQQRVALAKILLLSPKILLLDEPTKGMDAHFKGVFADILKDLKANGVTVVMVSHDIEFCAEHADRCAMFFDGNITSIGVPREFFAGKNFYTTSANRIARAILPEAVIAEDIILACGKQIPNKENKNTTRIILSQNDEKQEKPKIKKSHLTPQKIILGIVFAAMFVVTYLYQRNVTDIAKLVAIQILSVAEISACLLCFVPKKEFGIQTQQPKAGRKLSKRTAVAALLILLMIPLTIYVGIYYLQDRKYYFISLFIIVQTMIPFAMVFESRKPEARELIVISVLCAIAVAGRGAFSFLPQFKPVVALVIISGVCFGGETGFLVGAITGFVSNFFFSQGPWTPWQMFAFGIIGFLGGILFQKGWLRKTKVSLCIFGGFATLAIYGGIMNPASAIMSQEVLDAKIIISYYLSGLPYDLVHAVSTVFFLWFISEPMIEKLERIKIKYGLIQ